MQKNSKMIKKLLLEKYKDEKSELNYTNLYELLVAVMLSAQCSDKRVNIITPVLFKSYPDINNLAKAKLGFLKKLIQSCNFYNNKAINLIKMAIKVRDEYDGLIPLDKNKLNSLAGVGEKTANVVLIEYCDANLMAVDTHVFRVARRLGLSKANTPLLVNEDLSLLFVDDLGSLHQAMVLFGRYICKAKRPLCKQCFLLEFCNFNKIKSS